MTKEGHGVIGLQAGTNKYATQSSAGVVLGGMRHAADIRMDDMSKEGQGIIGLQAGTNKFEHTFNHSYRRLVIVFASVELLYYVANNTLQAQPFFKI